MKDNPLKKLELPGASPPRLLWTSISPKGTDYQDIKYVEALIGPQTIATIPLETLEAYLDHGDHSLQLEMESERKDSLDKSIQISQRFVSSGKRF